MSIGCFVKIGIGSRLNSELKAVQVYRVTQVVDVTEGPKVYNLGQSRTNKVFKLRHGNDYRNFRLEFVSNSEFTDAEFNDWRTRMGKDRIELISKEFIEKKLKDIQKAKNYNYKDSDIDAIVREKEKYKSIPVNFAVRKTELIKQKEVAEQLNNQDEVERISQMIEDLEEKAKEIDHRRTQNISAISYINEKNRMRNIQDSEKAIIEARVTDRETANDPFRRRKCAPTLVHKFTKNLQIVKTEGDCTDAASIREDSKDNFNTVIKSEPQSGGHSPKHTIASTNDLFSAHNFDIQIDFEIGVGLGNTTTSSNQSSNHSNLNFSPQPSSKIAAPNRRSLNLDEYKKKKGLI